MVDNLPARRGADLVAVAQQAGQIQALGGTLIASGLLPDSIKKPETALAIMLKGDEIGVGAMYALSHISIISGKPAMSAELMAALTQRSGHKIRTIESTDQRCVVVGIRRDDPTHETRIEFSMDDARRANLAAKSSWKTYPVDLLRSRAISRLCRTMFADAIAGMSYTPEELGAEVNEDGEVVDVTTETQPQSQDEHEAAVEVDTSVEDAEDAEHNEVIEEVEELLAQFSDDDLAEQDSIRQYAAESWEKAAVVRKRLRRLLDERDSENEEGESEREAEDKDSVDLDEDDVAEVEQMASGYFSGSEKAGPETPSAGGQPARKSQVDLLKTLAVELRAEDGVARLEETVGKPLSDLTRAEADDWLERLQPEEG